MNLNNLCSNILNNIKQHKAHCKQVNHWISQLKQIESKLDHAHNNLIEADEGEVEYGYACVVKRKALLKIFKDLQLKLPSIMYQQICVKCFNEQEHDHQEMVEQITQEEINIEQEIDDGQNLFFNQIDSNFIYNKLLIWVFQKPNYKVSKINQIKAVLDSLTIDREQLNQLILINNQTFNINKIQEYLKQNLEQQEQEFQWIDQQLQGNLKLNYLDKEQFDQTFICEPRSFLPQFLVCNYFQEYIFQDRKNNSLVVGDLQTQQIKLVLQVNKIMKIMKFSNDMQYFFCSDHEGWLICYHTKNYKQLFQLKLHKKPIKAFLHIRNNEIITYSFDGSVKITNLINLKVVLNLTIRDQYQFDYFEYIEQMNDQPNCIEYDEKNKIIFLANSSIRMRNRIKLQSKFNQQNQFQGIYQLQLIQNNSQLLSAGIESLQLYKFDKGILDCINTHYLKAFKFLANDDSKRIIIMGKCFFEVLDYTFKTLKIGNFDCQLDFCETLGTKFQIDKQNQCYIIKIYREYYVYQIEDQQIIIIKFQYYNNAVLQLQKKSLHYFSDSLTSQIHCLKVLEQINEFHKVVHFVQVNIFKINQTNECQCLFIN
ncbi:hypothetical protein pb186bvf_000941 [Paramecium bursaria]